MDTVTISGSTYLTKFLEHFQGKDIKYTTQLGRFFPWRTGEYDDYEPEENIHSCPNIPFGCCSGKKSHIIRIHLEFEIVANLDQTDRDFLYHLILEMLNHPILRYDEFSDINIKTYEYPCCEMCCPPHYVRRGKFHNTHQDTNCVFHNKLRCKICKVECPFHHETNCAECYCDYQPKRR